MGADGTGKPCNASLTMESVKHLHGLLAGNSLYRSDDDRWVEWSGLKQFCSKAPGLSFVFESLSN